MSRILSAVALLAVVAAGCGGGARPQRLEAHGVPRALARDWESQASAIATAAAAGDDCHALRLAQALRADVVATEHKLPLRLRAPLLTGVRALADRITCLPTPPAPAPPDRQPKPPKPPHKDHGHHGHHHGPHHGHGGGGGDEQ